MDCGGVTLGKFFPTGSKKKKECNCTGGRQKAGDQEELGPIRDAVMSQQNFDVPVKHGAQIVADSQGGKGEKTLSTGPNVCA